MVLAYLHNDVPHSSVPDCRAITFLQTSQGTTANGFSSSGVLLLMPKFRSIATQVNRNYDVALTGDAFVNSSFFISFVLFCFVLVLVFAM